VAESSSATSSSTPASRPTPSSTSHLNGTKRASDAAYGLAAQLLAAKLSIQATAGTCPAVLTAIAQGQALLDAANFIATGTYKNKIGATANSVAATLDAYNNNNLCP